MEPSNNFNAANNKRGGGRKGDTDLISAMTSPRLCEVSGQQGLGLAVNKSIIVSFQEEDQILYKSSPIPRSLTPVDSFPLVRAVGHGKRFQAIDGN